MMWGGFIYLLFQQLKYPKQREAFAMLLVLFVIAFYLTLILIARIEVYGHRMLIPALPVVLGLCVMGYERAWLHIRERS